MARSTNEQNKTQNCNTRKASQKATQSTTQKTTNSKVPANSFPVHFRTTMLG